MKVIKILIACSFNVLQVDGDRLSVEQIHGEGERLMGALLDLEEINPEMSSSSTFSDADRGGVTAEMTITAEDEVDALGKALLLVRTAIHAIGGMTPDWPQSGQGKPTAASFERRQLQLEYVA